MTNATVSQASYGGRKPTGKFKENNMAAVLAPGLERRLKAEITGDVLFSSFDRGRYATDASHYQVMPVGVVVPRSIEEAERAIALARQEGVSVLPRGGGTSQAGQTVNTSLVVDCSRNINRILDLDVAGRRCVVLGAGGAARALVVALADSKAAEVVVVNRSAGPAAVAAALAGDRGRVGTTADIAGAELLVNATSVGMGSNDLPARADDVHADQVVADIVVHPLDTAFLRAARAAGATTVDGLGMLVHQAARAFTLWTGVAAPVDVMRRAARAAVEARA